MVKYMRIMYVFTEALFILKKTFDFCAKSKHKTDIKPITCYNIIIKKKGFSCYKNRRSKLGERIYLIIILKHTNQ